jgi:hypothetical protein
VLPLLFSHVPCGARVSGGGDTGAPVRCPTQATVSVARQGKGTREGGLGKQPASLVVDDLESQVTVSMENVTFQKRKPPFRKHVPSSSLIVN